MTTEQIMIDTRPDGMMLVWLRRATKLRMKTIGQSLSRQHAAPFCLINERPSGWVAVPLGLEPKTKESTSSLKMIRCC